MGAFRGSLGLTALFMVLMPTQIGYQDLAALFARQPGVAERWRAHLMASPFGTIHAATFNFPHPVGTTIPQPIGYGLASLDRRSFENFQPIYGRIVIDRDIADPLPPLDYPAVERAHKGDLLAPRSKPKPEAQPDQVSPEKSQPAKPREDAGGADAPAFTAERPPADTAPPSRARDPNSTPFAPQESAEAADAESAPPVPVDTENPAMRMARLFFGNDVLGPTAEESIEPWAPGEEPVVMTPHPPVDADIKRSALGHDGADKDKPGGAEPDAHGETVASKGEVTGAGRRPKTPAERLGLQGKDRVRAEKCLTNAIYFEARGEPERGQIAVAQVVMNRVFSGYYPGNVCGVVYQDSHRHLSCQFTFTCDGIPEVVNEPDAWEVAKRIARDTLDGKLWLPEVGKATHYHAYWVHPSWVREMKKLYKFGVHTFYRPLAWGNGADAFAWGPGAKSGDVEATGSVPAKPDAAKAKM
jgi:spore germination cell wall hydrolase CwlJ-like protein